MSDNFDTKDEVGGRDFHGLLGRLKRNDMVAYVVYDRSTRDVGITIDHGSYTLHLIYSFVLAPRTSKSVQSMLENPLATTIIIEKKL